MKTSLSAESSYLFEEKALPQPVRSDAVDSSYRTLRLLVVIASFGEKNLDYLKSVIRTYQGMSLDVGIIVVSNAPKDLGPDVRVIVGLPTKNPWSLPFAHKPIFAEQADAYDLFIYSEDDMAVTEKNIQAFLRITPHLEPNEIAGFLRYEVDPSGTWSLPDVHDSFHWKADSVRRRDHYTIAQFTNDHAGFYILTRGHLRKALASENYLRPPYEGRYGFLETAATDPYTCCTFRKVICISDLNDFLIHHTPNKYLGRLGLPLPSFKSQVQTLMEIAQQSHPVSTLCEVESAMLPGQCSKSYYERPNDALLSMIPSDAKTVLSVGAGWGATEVILKRRGALVTALPLDSVIGSAVERLGIEVIYGSMNDCFRELTARTFDCVLLANLIHLQPDPNDLLKKLSRFVARRGKLVISGPNVDPLRMVLKHLFRKASYGASEKPRAGGIQIAGPRSLRPLLRDAGMAVSAVRWHDANPQSRLAFLQRFFPRLRQILASDWTIQGTHIH